MVLQYAAVLPTNAMAGHCSSNVAACRRRCEGFAGLQATNLVGLGLAMRSYFLHDICSSHLHIMGGMCWQSWRECSSRPRRSCTRYRAPDAACRDVSRAPSLAARRCDARERAMPECRAQAMLPAGSGLRSCPVALLARLACPRRHGDTAAQEQQPAGRRTEGFVTDWASAQNGLRCPGRATDNEARRR